MGLGMQAQLRVGFKIKEMGLKPKHARFSNIVGKEPWLPLICRFGSITQPKEGYYWKTPGSHMGVSENRGP